MPETVTRQARDMIADWRLAEALTIQALHGDDAVQWIAIRVAELFIAGDMAGAERFSEIATKLDDFLAIAARPH